MQDLLLTGPQLTCGHMQSLLSTVLLLLCCYVMWLVFIYYLMYAAPLSPKQISLRGK